jgi:carboxyl-terminal processing protease
MKAFLLSFLLFACSWVEADTTPPPGPVIGIGTELRLDQHQPIVGRVLPGSPAEKAGMRKDDRFVRVDDANVANLSLGALTSKLRGAVGSPVHVTILRHGAEKTFAMKREILLMPGAHLPQ